MAINKKFIIAHLHVADKNNKGDLAIVLAVQELLRKQFINCRIIDIPVDVLKNGGSIYLKKINSADFVVIGGGGIFYSYFLPYNTDFIKKIKKPIIIFGVGYIREIGAPELNSVSALSVAALVDSAVLVGVRDNNTKKFLLKYGVSATKIKVIGDPAVLLSEVKPTQFEKKIIRTSAKNKSVKSLKPLKSLKSLKPLIKIGLNLNYSGWLGFGKWREDILNSYRTVAEYFQENFQAEIYYFKHHPGENNIYPYLNIKNLKVIDLVPRQQKYVYGQMDLVIGMMLHSGVLAFGAGAPEISVAYDLRNYSFAEFIGHPELVIDLANLKKGELLKRAKQVFTKRKKCRLIFKRLFIFISKKQTDFLREIIKHI